MSKKNDGFSTDVARETHSIMLQCEQLRSIAKVGSATLSPHIVKAINEAAVTIEKLLLNPRDTSHLNKPVIKPLVEENKPTPLPKNQSEFEPNKPFDIKDVKWAETTLRKGTKTPKICRDMFISECMGTYHLVVVRNGAVAIKHPVTVMDASRIQRINGLKGVDGLFGSCTYRTEKSNKLIKTILNEALKKRT